MEQILKEARLGRAELDEGELALVNAQTLRKLEAEEVFTFRLAACDNQVDRIMRDSPMKPWRSWQNGTWAGRCCWITTGALAIRRPGCTLELWKTAPGRV